MQPILAREHMRRLREESVYQCIPRGKHFRHNLFDMVANRIKWLFKEEKARQDAAAKPLEATGDDGTESTEIPVRKVK